MKKALTFLSLLIFLTACGSGKTTGAEETESDTESTQVGETNGEREPTDDEINEFGLIKGIEDSGYPMFAIDVEFPERQMMASYRFNVEESPLNVEQLTAMKGKYATIYYITEDDPLIESIIRDCDPVWGEVAPDSNGIEEITGVLSGADATSGDLPGTITITASDGSTKDFDIFIEEEMVAVNGTEVTVFYYENSTQTITYLKESEN